MIGNKEIESALASTNRQYLVGQLDRPQKLKHIEGSNLEIGISSYNDFTHEAPHYHTQANEYIYVISGMTEYLEVETGTEYRFKKGDFYKIPPGFHYAQKSKPGTTILFVKSPSGNDKQEIEVSKIVNDWLNTKIKTTRLDFTNKNDAPAVNSIRPAAAVGIVNENEEILLLERRDSGKWTMPGGTLEIGEDLKTCAIREVQEELGYTVEVTDFIGTYTNPEHIIAYSDGEVRQEFAILYKGTIKSGNPRIDDESTAYKWIKLEKATELPMAESQKQRILDVIDFQKEGVRALR
ncbi:NUDIX domain-containing protein [Pseudalkalibacillus caeni]|uniref:NUDIX domain-containing protein n=2 Tax=Exobacillus caeni TaxID=2574798 RepID=A0A5R9FDU5_9BACL|nr:NUDIX domain-containing protein [Pseudalkalibacillus caeni]